MVITSMDHEDCMGHGLTVSVPCPMDRRGMVDPARYDKIMTLFTVMVMDLDAQALGRVTHQELVGLVTFQATWDSKSARELALAYLNLAEPELSTRKFYNGGRDGPAES